MSKAVLDRAELTQMLGISIRQSQLLELKGQLPPHVLLSPRKKRWLKSDVIAFLKQRAQAK